MNSSGSVNLAVTALLLIWLLSRQLTARPLRDTSRIGFVLAAVGIVGTVSFFSDRHLGAKDAGVLVLTLLLGGVLAAVRAYTVRLWSENGQTYRKGGVLTAVLWIAGIGLHLLIDSLVTPGLGSATVLLYFGVVLLVQRQVLTARANRPLRQPVPHRV
ncbi:hypothetical protein [Streptomyces sp. 150FB]|uniref:hypothetical protein n=1 Tax=Streptomyces sp. 150FB TaxID=1576605 RepID=UPI000698D5A1|nr:hypothetical protein [Streptomyces sp. 150FB]